jgi:hypothetical protein
VAKQRALAILIEVGNGSHVPLIGYQVYGGLQLAAVLSPAMFLPCEYCANV